MSLGERVDTRGGLDAQDRGVVGEGPRWRQGRPGRSSLLVACLFLALSCGKGQAHTRPVASLADTTAAGRAFEHLHAAWARNEPAERKELRRDLEAFAEVFPKDGKAQLARIYLALSFMDPPADWADADRRLESMEPPPPGALHDLYVIAVAKSRRHRHDPDGAFELLRPLVGKVIDGRARGLLQEELTFDALESRQPFEAIAYMDAWLRGASEEDRAASEGKVAVALNAVPEATLRTSLEGMRASAKAGESRGYGLAIQRLVTERLARIAVERGDAGLARWLLDPAAGEAMLDEELAAALGGLATSRRGIGSVAGRTVGLVLPTGSGELRDEAADVLRGVLGVVRDKGPDGVRLVTRDDGGDPVRLQAAMEEVAGEGATVVLTALDRESAASAVKWAGAASLNVIVLASPGASMEKGGVDFTVGEDWTLELSALASASDSSRASASRGNNPQVASLADTEAMSFVLEAAKQPGAPWAAPFSCDVAPTAAGDSRFPLSTWAAAGVRRWLVAGSSACADDLIRGLRKPPRAGTVLLSLEASGAEERGSSALRLLTATAGIIPLSLAPPTDPRAREAAALASGGGARVGWWTALGHDAAVLAAAAVTALPEDMTTDATEITRRRKLAGKALADARVSLWTSDEHGFDASHTLPRSIHVAELSR